jgi:hypothetical protein
MKKSLPLPKILILKHLLKIIRLSSHALFALIRFRPERLPDTRSVFRPFLEQHIRMSGPKMIKPKRSHPKPKPLNRVLLPPVLIASPEPLRGLNITKRWSSARSAPV